MRSVGKITITTICLLFIAAGFFSASAYAKEQSNDALVQERTAVCYVDGVVFDDLVLGAQGSIQFVYLDAKLSRALSKAHSDIAEAKTPLYPFPEWMEEGNNYFSTGKRRDSVTFIAKLETFKPWEVDPTQIFVSGYRLTKNDVLSPSMTNPFGDVPSGTTGYFAFSVPGSQIKAGAEINLGYGEYSVKWKVPK